MANKPLPKEIIADILSRLPAESFLRFKCVSKPWLSLISDPHFVKSHLQRASENEHDHHMVLRVCDKYGKLSSAATTVDAHPVDCHSNNWNRLELPCEKNGPRSVKILGSCDGLVCLASKEGDNFVWNPSTRQHNKLSDRWEDSDNYTRQKCSFGLAYDDGHGPHDCIHGSVCADDYRHDFHCCGHGFGYDRSTDDYRLIVKYNSGFKTQSMNYEIASLKNNSWRRGVQELDTSYDGRMECISTVLLNGAIYWLVTSFDMPQTERFSVIAFDLASERFKETLVPRCCERACSKLRVVKGCICVHELWMMKEEDHKAKPF